MSIFASSIWWGWRLPVVTDAEKRSLWNGRMGAWR